MVSLTFLGVQLPTADGQGRSSVCMAAAHPSSAVVVAVISCDLQDFHSSSFAVLAPAMPLLPLIVSECFTNNNNKTTTTNHCIFCKAYNVCLVLAVIVPPIIKYILIVVLLWSKLVRDTPSFLRLHP